MKATLMQGDFEGQSSFLWFGYGILVWEKRKRKSKKNEKKDGKGGKE